MFPELKNIKKRISAAIAEEEKIQHLVVGTYFPILFIFFVVSARVKYRQLHDLMAAATERNVGVARVATTDIIWWSYLVNIGLA